MAPTESMASPVSSSTLVAGKCAQNECSKFGDTDWRAINTIRLLSADMVQRANSGHPGAPMGLAPLAHVLFSRHFRCAPSNPNWMGRDRFVLSNGHACALQYSILHLLGYNLTMEDLKSFRELDSKTPGHPECHMTPGVEVTTGPLGQGFANAVGMAAAEEHMAATFNRAEDGFRLIDNFTYVFMGDGCMQEGVAAEAASLAGHLQLGKLIVFYDDNHITIDGDTELAFTEDVEGRFRAYGFHVLHVEDGDNDLEGLDAAIAEAKATADRPSLIRVRTTIGIGSKAAGSEKVHGAPLGNEDLVQAKRNFGFDPNESFVVPDEVRALYRAVTARGEEAAAQWTSKLASFALVQPVLAAELERRVCRRLPTHLKPEILPRFDPSAPAMATRKLSEQLLNVLAPVLPELVGGSADLTGSNLTYWRGANEFQSPSLKQGSLGTYAGRYWRFGVREHGMFAVMNGLAAYGGLLPFGATFLNFISYGMGAVRLTALSHLPAIFVMTHDSIGLGEDGPTHQPIETLPALRALPNILVMRPADGNEVSAAYWAALQFAAYRQDSPPRPSVLCFSRQNLPHLKGSSFEDALRGAYILEDFEALSRSGEDGVILLATGSEVALAVEAAALLRTQHSCSVRVVSMPCRELFAEQSFDYQRAVLPAGVPVVSIEAASTFGWSRWAHASIGIDQFGSSGPYKQVYEKYGLTGPEIAQKALRVAAFYRAHPVPDLLANPLA